MRKHSVSWAHVPVNIPGISYRRYNSELAFQVYAAHWLRAQYAITGAARFNHWHHSANERSNPREGFLAKLSGQSKGFPDLIHLGLKLAIELKIPGGKPSKHQIEWLLYLRSIGYRAEVVYSFEEFTRLILSVK